MSAPSAQVRRTVAFLSLCPWTFKARYLKSQSNPSILDLNVLTNEDNLWSQSLQEWTVVAHLIRFLRKYWRLLLTEVASLCATVYVLQQQILGSFRSMHFRSACCIHVPLLYGKHVYKFILKFKAQGLKLKPQDLTFKAQLKTATSELKILNCNLGT